MTKMVTLYKDINVLHYYFNSRLIDLFSDTAAILIFIVSKDIMACSGGKLIRICPVLICPLGIP